jgi:hypothetical protein
MHSSTTICAYAVPLLLSAALLCVAQSPTRLPSASETRTITASIADADSGTPLSNTSVKVQLFPPEHGARKLRSLLCVPSDDAQPLLSFDLTTDQNGSFSLTAPGGPYLAKITIPQRQPIFGCVFFDTEASVRACGVDLSSMRLHQHLFIRTANSIPDFPVTSSVIPLVLHISPRLVIRFRFLISSRQAGSCFATLKVIRSAR